MIVTAALLLDRSCSQTLLEFIAILDPLFKVIVYLRLKQICSLKHHNTSPNIILYYYIVSMKIL